MLTLIAIVHSLIAVALILFVLLQDPKGGAAGVFGGGGGGANSLFGATGADNFLTTTTKWLAIFFAITCIGLTYLTARRSGSVMDTYANPATETAPATAPEPQQAAPNEAAPAPSEAPAEGQSK
jgi:preprotein translocase subunit SecG